MSGTAYLGSTPAYEQSIAGLISAEPLGAVGAFPVEGKIFGWDG